MVALKSLLIMFLLLISGNCFPQTSLEVYNDDDKLIGWLMGAGQNHWQILTPDKTILSLSSTRLEGSLAFLPPHSGELYYEDNNCADQAYILIDDTNPNIIRWQLFQLGSRAGSVFGMRTSSTSIKKNVNSRKTAAGICVELGSALLGSFYPIEERAPAEFGIVFSEKDGWWGVFANLVFSRPDLLFCNGFENCPSE